MMNFPGRAALSTCLAAATKPITHAINSPPYIVVGATAMFGVNDNGGLGSPPDEFVGPAFPPASLGDLTAQQMFGIVGAPLPQAFQPLLFGIE
ncbi:MAG: hypothetical protein ACI89X_001191 [Planctomycetota bacterium]|jgi:hypothetical protein